MKSSERWVGSMIGVMFMGSTIVTPLHSLYAQRFGFSKVVRSPSALRPAPGLHGSQNWTARGIKAGRRSSQYAPSLTRACNSLVADGVFAVTLAVLALAALAFSQLQSGKREAQMSA